MLLRKALMLLSGCLLLMTASPRAQTEELLWPKGAPGATGNDSNSKPSLTYYPADAAKATGVSVVICPGGGYGHLATEKEGNQVAKWLNTLGVAGFVLRYRFAPYRHPIEMNDGKRAMRWVRANAGRFKIDAARVGILGFSAGGHLASTVATHYDEGNPAAADTVDRQSCKPLFQILVYPVITLESPYVHAGSRDNLLGTNPSAELVRLLSNEKHVDAKTPPAFLVHAKDDPAVAVQNTTMYYDSLVKAGVPARTRLYDHGPHGFGLANGVAPTPDIPELATWPAFCASWMQERGYLEKATGLAERPGSRAVPAAAFRIKRSWYDFLGRWKSASSIR